MQLIVSTSLFGWITDGFEIYVNFNGLKMFQYFQ